MHCSRYLIAEGLEKAQPLCGKSIQLGVRYGKHSDQTPVPGMERNRHFGKCGIFAADVVLIHAHVGGVTHLPGRGHVADHAFFANLKTLPFAMKAAAMHSGQNQLAVLLVVQVNVSLDATERACNLIHDSVDERIEVKNRGDVLSGFL